LPPVTVLSAIAAAMLPVPFGTIATSTVLEAFVALSDATGIDAFGAAVLKPSVQLVSPPPPDATHAPSSRRKRVVPAVAPGSGTMPAA
jgi:hypothetical protein